MENFTKNRLIERKEGYVVIIPKEDDGGIPFNCPRCNKRIRNSFDSICYRKYKVCGRCEPFVYKRKEEDI